MQEVYSAYVWQCETNVWFIKWAWSEDIAERTLNITSILNNFIPLIKQVYQKEIAHKFNKKRDQNNYLRQEITQTEEKLVPLEEKKHIDF